MFTQVYVYIYRHHEADVDLRLINSTMGKDQTTKPGTTTLTLLFTENEKATTRSASFSSKISNAWKVFKRNSSRRDSYISHSLLKGRQVLAVKYFWRPGNYGRSHGLEAQFRRKLKQGNSSTKTNNKPFHGIQELGGDDSTLDRDLYMKINNLTVTHDTGQFALRYPFLVQEDIATSSEVPIDYFTMILEEEDSPKEQGKKKFQWLSFLARLKRKKN